MAYNKLSTYATTIAARDGNTVITYHSTAIVEFDADFITLRTGGYETVTTKRKMNQAANQFDLGYSVFQKRGIWFVNYNGSTYEFEGTEMQLSRRNGNVYLDKVA